MCRGTSRERFQMATVEPGSLLRRYRAGEHAAVWTEMTAMGAAVREAPCADDAVAVARETMRRVRHNLELLIRRLDAMGYRFWNGKQGKIAGPPRKVTFGGRAIEAPTLELMLAAMFEAAAKVPPADVTPVMVEQLHNIYRMVMFPYQDTARLARGERLPLDAEATALFEQAKKLPSGQLPAALLAQLRRLHRQALDQVVERWKERDAASPPKPPPSSDHLKDKKVFCPPATKDLALIRALEKKGIPLPLSLRAWIEAVGSVNLAGSHPSLCFWEDESFSGVYADPLMVMPPLFLSEIEDWRKERDPGEPLDALLGWDAKTKARLVVEDVQLDYGYTMTLPDAAADAALKGAPNATSFVDYLRRSFRWGGFPGWEHHEKRPEAVLAQLAEDLLPI
jgi:hypothetical protein